MTLEWIGDAVLLVVLLPVVDLPSRGVLRRRQQDRPQHPSRSPTRRRRRRRDLDAAPLLLTTQQQVIKTIETAANYGGSLDVILDDA